MENISIDPYERQLMSEFNTYDIDNNGSLDRNGLKQLCSSLQLDDAGAELIKYLFSSTGKTRITFADFKEGLLVFLRDQQMNKSPIESDTDNESPDREVSPKFVYGSKKYGRRSRPCSDNQLESPLNEDEEVFCNIENKAVSNVRVQRSNSQNDVLSKKRKTNFTLKRCTSFPGNKEMEKVSNWSNIDRELLSKDIPDETSIECDVNMLRVAWERLGVGRDGYLNQTELALVCDSIGLPKLTESVVRHLSNEREIDYETKISFKELLEVLQKDDCWSGILSSAHEKEPTVDSYLPKQSVLCSEIKTMQCLTLGPNGNGMVSVDILVDMWESCGINSPRTLLQELGFINNQVVVTDLAAVLEEELRNISTDVSLNSHPHAVLLQALLTLYQSEVKFLNSILEQVKAERDKLRNDVADANQRACLLAQEVDDNHAKMEKSTRNQVRLLEQKHSETVKHLTEQLVNERDHITFLNAKLESKISDLEAEEVRLRNELLSVQNYSNALEKENRTISKKLSDLLTVKDTLTEKVLALENERQRIVDIEKEQEQVKSLLEKVTVLQRENSHLRDKNDELCADVERLTVQVSNLGNHSSHEENVPIVCEGIGLGAKRRGDSPIKSHNEYLEGDSPRLGKMRRCNRFSESHLKVPVNPNESGFEFESPDCSLTNSDTGQPEEVTQLQERIRRLETVLLEHSIPIPDNGQEVNSDHMRHHYENLVQLFDKVKSDVIQILSTKDIPNNNACSKDDIAELSKRLANIITKNEDKTLLELKEKLLKQTKENTELLERCSDFEASLSLMQKEYENCENYWSSKLNDERKLFELDQKQSNEKYDELLEKILEYEEKFAQDQVDNRLPTIDERLDLETQFTDLEKEYHEYRNKMEVLLNDKNKEIAVLEIRMDDLIKRQSRMETIATQTSQEPTSPKVNLTNHIESTNIFSSETIPYTSFGIRATNIESSDSKDSYCSPDEIEEFASLPVYGSTQQQHIVSEQPRSLSEYPQQPNSSSCRPIRGRKLDRNTLNSKYGSQKNIRDQAHVGETQAKLCGFCGSDDERSCFVKVRTLHQLHAKLYHYEQKCRHLQLVLRHQQVQSEKLLHHNWQCYQSEMKELHDRLRSTQAELQQRMCVCTEHLERLRRSDVLVKDLYCENSFLLANTHRLAHQCNLLAQYNGSSSV